MNRIIWLFRETRSGSTWLVDYMCLKLNKKSVFLEKDLPENLQLSDKVKKLNDRVQLETDYNSILHTHVYELSTILGKYDNPIVIRCSRKNKFEQFLSWCSIKYSNYQFYNLQKNQNIFDKKLYNKFISKKILVTKHDYSEWLSYEIDRINKFWDLSKPFENHVVYYEDMLDGTASIPQLNLYNIKMDDNLSIIRLPETYKKDMIINYNEVKEWFTND
jgi:hypothetical protein